VEALQLFGVRANARTGAKTLKVQLVQLIQDQAQGNLLGATGDEAPMEDDAADWTDDSAAMSSCLRSDSADWSSSIDNSPYTDWSSSIDNSPYTVPEDAASGHDEAYAASSVMDAMLGAEDKARTAALVSAARAAIAAVDADAGDADAGEWQAEGEDQHGHFLQSVFSNPSASLVQAATSAGVDTDTETKLGTSAAAAAFNMAIIYQKQGNKAQAVGEFHKSLELEIKARGDNHPLPLLFESMLEHRAKEYTNFTIPTEEKWLDILDQVRGQTPVKEESEGKRMGKGARSIKRDLKIAPRGGAVEALAGMHTAQDVVLLDGEGRRYVHQKEVFGLLIAALAKEDECAATLGSVALPPDIEQLRKKVKKNYCNITDEVVDDFLRALNVCYYLAGTTVVTPPAGSKAFESLCPPPSHNAYMQSEYLQKVLPKVKRSLSDADLNEAAATRFKDFLARSATPPATLVLSGEVKNRSECLGAYTLCARTHLDRPPMWRHENGDSFIAHESGDRYRGTAMAQLVKMAEEQGAIVNKIKTASHTNKEELDAAERKLKQLKAEVANGYWAVQKKEDLGDNVHDCMRLSDANVLFPHQSRVAWKEADGKGGWFDAAGLKCDAGPPPGTLQGPGLAPPFLPCARNTTAAEVAATANAGRGGLGKKRGRSLIDEVNERVNHATTPPLANHAPTTESIQVCVEHPQKQQRVLVQRLMRERGYSWGNVLALLLAATACTTVVIVGTMDEGQLKDQPFQRRLLGISVAGQYVEGGSENQKHLAFAGLLMCLVAAMVIFLELRRRWQLNCKDPWKNLETGRNCKDLEPALQTLAEEDLEVLVEGIWFHLERPEVVAGALTAVLKIMAGPHAAKVFQVPAVADEKADENARKAFRVGVLEVTLASMEKHMRERDVLAPACGVLWAINASPEAVEIRVDTVARHGIRLLFGALESFGTDRVIVEAVLSAMGNLMYENDDNKGVMMAARARLNNGNEASGVERVIELLEEGVDAGHAGIQESAVNVLRKLANAGPPSRRFKTLRDKNRLKSAAKERLNKLKVDEHVRKAMERPHATDNFKEDGQKLLNRLKKVAEKDTTRRRHTGGRAGVAAGERRER
jgi:hypothetical protein